ncbi:MAG TPA: hypothetical protein VN132_02120, partial [Bdellovibrio sp.]|nr:hypothetical protein [Bdellovibrio sp.]
AERKANFASNNNNDGETSFEEVTVESVTITEEIIEENEENSEEELFAEAQDEELPFLGEADDIDAEGEASI